jgi:hypothetical protein
MRRAIGFLIVLWGLSQFLEQSFSALDDATTQSLRTLETAASVAEERMLKK